MVQNLWLIYSYHNTLISLNKKKSLNCKKTTTATGNKYIHSRDVLLTNIYIYIYIYYSRTNIFGKLTRTKNDCGGALVCNTTQHYSFTHDIKFVKANPFPTATICCYTNKAGGINN